MIKTFTCEKSEKTAKVYQDFKNSHSNCGRNARKVSFLFQNYSENGCEVDLVIFKGSSL